MLLLPWTIAHLFTKFAGDICPHLDLPGQGIVVDLLSSSNISFFYYGDKLLILLLSVRLELGNYEFDQLNYCSVLFAAEAFNQSYFLVLMPIGFVGNILSFLVCGMEWHVLQKQNRFWAQENRLMSFEEKTEWTNLTLSLTVFGNSKVFYFIWSVRALLFW